MKAARNVRFAQHARTELLCSPHLRWNVILQKRSHLALKRKLFFAEAEIHVAPQTVTDPRWAE
jgi:hypothetical protein